MVTIISTKVVTGASKKVVRTPAWIVEAPEEVTVVIVISTKMVTGASKRLSELLHGLSELLKRSR